ncbi:MAG: OmpA family protein [Bacteroidetes bacterium]|nr:OmpA family protein [Bacteroidota bacterium]
MNATKICILTAFFAFAISFGSSAQIQKANRYYEMFEYAKAIPLYLSVIEKGNKDAEEATLKLADSYRRINNYKEASKWYAKAVTFDSVSATTYYYYAQSLRSNGKYLESQKWFVKYDSLSPGDQKSSNYFSFVDSLFNWTPKTKYSIENAAALNSSFADFSPAIFKDGIIFASDRPGKDAKIFGWTGDYYLNLYFAKMDTTSRKISFQSPGLFSQKINNVYHDGPASFNKDFSMIYFTRSVRERGNIDSSKLYTNKLKIFFSEYKKEQWTDPKPLFLNNDKYSVGHPVFSSDSKTIYFVSDMPGGYGRTDIYTCHYVDTVGWSQPINLGTNINTFAAEMFPYLYNDSTLYFASDGHPGYGSLDLFRSVKVYGYWSTPENLMAPFNSTEDDFGILILNKNLSFISSNRPGGLGNDDIYIVRQLKEEKPPVKPVYVYSINGFVKDEATLKPIANATVFIWDKEKGIVKILKTNASGYYSQRVDKGHSLTLKAMKEEYNSDTLNMNISQNPVDTSIHAKRDLLLSKLELNQVFRIEKIYYDYDKWNIRPDAAIELDKAASFLGEHPEITVELGSHTDSRGSDIYNQKLSERRAESAVNYIIEKGVKPSNIVFKGYGESQLVNSCTNGVTCTAEQHQANRRTEIKITGFIKVSDTTTSNYLDKFSAGDSLSIGSFNLNFFNLIKDVNKQKIQSEQNEPGTDKKENAKAPSDPNKKSTSPETSKINKSDISGTTYSIQIAASNVREDKLFKDITKLIICTCNDGYVRYFTGSFSSIAEAQPLLKDMQKKGYKDAWITKIDNINCKCEQVLRD